jgi:hypothetical protein
VEGECVGCMQVVQPRVGVLVHWLRRAPPACARASHCARVGGWSVNALDASRWLERVGVLVRWSWCAAPACARASLCVGGWVECECVGCTQVARSRGCACALVAARTTSVCACRVSRWRVALGSGRVGCGQVAWLGLCLCSYSNMQRPPVRARLLVCGAGWAVHVSDAGQLRGRVGVLVHGSRHARAAHACILTHGAPLVWRSRSHVSPRSRVWLRLWVWLQAAPSARARAS